MEYEKHWCMESSLNTLPMVFCLLEINYFYIYIKISYLTSGELLFKSHSAPNHIVPEKSLMAKDDSVRGPQQIKREKKNTGFDLGIN